MKKQISGLLMIGTLVMTALLPIGANAADTSSDSTKPSGVTEATVTFQQRQQYTAPVDPDDPTKLLDLGKGTNNGVSKISSGELAILYAPAKLDFGQLTIDHVNLTHNPATLVTGSKDGNLPQKLKDHALFEVSYLPKEGAGTGWQLNAALSTITQGDNGPVLQGATIALPQGHISTGVKVADGTAVSKDSSSEPTVPNGAIAQEATLQQNAAVSTILQADTGKGTGLTFYQITPKEIKLNVMPNTASVGTYTGTITWSLQDTDNGQNV